jgi:hypothetical protein
MLKDWGYWKKKGQEVWYSGYLIPIWHASMIKKGRLNLMLYTYILLYRNTYILIRLCF